jgi:hypothetical protein
MNHTAAKIHTNKSNTTAEVLATSRQLLFLKSPENPFQLQIQVLTQLAMQKYMVTASEMKQLMIN